ncbi:MAG: hypothetical protein KGZ25_14505, partial [Planctomycetes bacterium]|nr:hypothetical protein [Planctomycetota bacterium]
MTASVLNRRGGTVLTYCVIFLLGIFLFECDLAAGEDSATKIPLEKIGRTIYLERAGGEKKCVAANLFEAGGRFFNVPISDLKAGVYRAHFRLKVSHTISKHTSLLEFNIGTKGGCEKPTSRSLSIVDFKLPGTYQNFVVPFAVSGRRKRVLLTAGWDWRGKADERPPEPVDMPDAGEQGAMDVGNDEKAIEPLQHKLTELPYHLALDRLWVECVGDAEIRGVTVDKIRYEPKEPVIVTGEMRNFAAERREFQLNADLVRGIDERQNVHQRIVTVDGRRSRKFEFIFDLPNKRWGHAIECRISENGRTIDRASEVFSVHTNPWAVAVGSFPMDLTIYRAGPGFRNADECALSRKNNYANQVEFVFWAPDDFGDLTPEGKYWSGQMRRRNSAESTRQLIRAFHRVGVSCAVYIKLTAGGKAGYELLRRHPEWMEPMFYDMHHLDRWERSKEMVSWPQLRVRRGMAAPYIHHAEEIVRSVKEFGWDAVRYDTGWQKPDSSAILELVKREVRESCPQLQWGYNTGLHRRARQPKPVVPAWGEDVLPAEFIKSPRPAFDVLCENGGMVMGEYNRHAGQDGWTYKRYASRHVGTRDKVHQREGHLVFCPFEPKMDSDALYQDILPLAARAHRAWDPLKGRTVLADYDRFATRYA